MTTITYTGELAVVTCWCGMAHAVPTELREYQSRAHANGEKVPDIYCPLGHSHIPAGKGTAQVEREKREASEKRLRAARELLAAEERLRAARELLAAEERAHAATRGQLTKARKKAAAAMCPVEGCGRQFVNLANHLHAKHPDFAHPANNGTAKP